MEAPHPAEVIECLRREQAHAVQLYLQYKGYHWNVKGPQFHDLHLLFDEHAKLVLDMIDPLAERQRILGAPAHYDLESLARTSHLAVDAHLPASALEMTEHLLEAHRHIIRGLRAGIELSMEARDAGTADLLTQTLESHEKMEWFLREILETRVEAVESPGPVPATARHHGPASPGVA